jgi:di/tricarboxylate transporter
METFQLVAVFIILGLSFLFFLKEWLPPDLVALGALALCIVTGMLSTEEVGDVFKSNAPITIGAMFVLSAGLTRTGVIEWLAQLYQRLARKSETRALVVLALIVMPLSAFVNNTPVVVIFLPILISFARSAQLKSSRLLMPLSFFSIMGGTITLLGTSTTILVAGVAREEGLDPIGVFEITPVGLIYAAVGSLYMFTIGRKLLPDRETVSSLFAAEDQRSFFTTALVPEGSPLVGHYLQESKSLTGRGLRVFDIIREGQRLVSLPLNEIQLKVDDRIVLKTSVQGIATMRESGELIAEKGDNGEKGGQVKLVEVMVGPQSPLAGHTLAQLRLRNQYGIIVAALHRSGVNVMEKLDHVKLEMGDTLLVEGPAENMQRLVAREDGLIVLNDEVERPYRKGKAPLAIVIILAVVTLAGVGVMPIMSAALVGAIATMLLGCVDPREAYESIDWSILFIIFGMLGLGKAMETTGAAALIADNAAVALTPFGPLAVLAMIYLLASVLTEMVTNNAVAILMTPIAISIAEGMNVDPRAFVFAIIFGASASFMTPIGYQTNTYVFGAGGYRFTDFIRVGLPLNLILWGVAVLVIPLVWKF